MSTRIEVGGERNYRQRMRFERIQSTYHTYVRDHYHSPQTTLLLDGKKRRAGELSDHQLYRAATQARDEADRLLEAQYREGTRERPRS